MNIGEILVWESTNALLLIPVVIVLVMLVRWIRGRAVFTEKDWLFLFGHPRGREFSRSTCGLDLRCYGLRSCLSPLLRATFCCPLVSWDSLARSSLPPL